MTIGFRNNLFVSFWKKWQFVLCQIFHYGFFTGKSENLADTSILKDILFFFLQMSLFSKSLVSSGDIKFS